MRPIPPISALSSRRTLALLLLPAATSLSACGGPTGTDGGDPPTATQLEFTVTPDDAAAGVPLSPSVEVEVQDASGDRVSSSSASVSIALENNPGGATLGGETTVAASDGVAEFDDLTLAVPAEGYVLEATSGSLTPAISDSFAVQLVFGEISAGGGHTCAVTVADRLHCWGLNADGQLGSSTSDSCESGSSSVACSTVPAAVETGSTFAQVSAGRVHTCAVTTEGEAYCWGSNGYGQLGDGTTTDRASPTAVSATVAFERVSAGRFHSCGLTADGEAVCWGRNDGGQLGDGTTTDRTAPVAVSSARTFREVSAGGFHTCAVTTTDEAYCWGDNGEGQLGDGTTTDRTSPTAVSTAQSFGQLRAGELHTCGVTTADEAYCWGANSSGQLGDDTNTDRTEPVAVSTTNSFARVSPAVGNSGFHTCGVTTTDEAYCWGRNGEGQLGDGTTTSRAAPVPVSGLLALMRTSAGESHSCGVTTDGEAYCWGYNEWGQLGDSTTTDASGPTAVSR